MLKLTSRRTKDCEICKRTDITRAPYRRRTGEAVPRAENFGDLITADHKVLNEEGESRNNHRYAVVAQDLASRWIQSYPCKTKTSQETEKSVRKFLEPSQKTKVIYTDKSLEFGKSCEDLSWNHRTSTPHRSETNGIAGRAVRRAKEGTSAVLLQSGLDEKWWADSLECHCYLRNVQDLLAVGTFLVKDDSDNHSRKKCFFTGVDPMPVSMLALRYEPNEPRTLPHKFTVQYTGLICATRAQQRI